MQGKAIGPVAVGRVLREAGVNYVLVGAHAANGYTGRPRATIDVDVVVQFPKKAARAVAAAFPQLTPRDTPVVTRFLTADGDEAIDLMKPTSSPLWKRLLKDPRVVTIENEPLRIPSLEGMLAAKFASMVSIGRRMPDRQQDAVDFARMIDANPQIDEPALKDLGELVYPGGGADVLKLVADARAGRRLDL